MSELSSRAFFIGGATCSGKTLLADLLGERYGLSVYHLDKHTQGMQARADEVAHPAICAMRGLADSEWFIESPDTLLVKTLATEREYAEMAFVEMAEIDGELIADGVDFHPGLLAEEGLDPSRAVFLVATPEFRESTYVRTRPWRQKILDAHADPDAAWAIWMEKDRLEGEWIAEQAVMHSMPVITIDGSVTVEVVKDRVAELLGLDAAA